MFKKTNFSIAAAVAAASSSSSSSSSKHQTSKSSRNSERTTNKNNNKSNNNKDSPSGNYFHHQRLSPFQLSQQQPYSWLFLSTVERGCSAEGVRLLSAHPEAPSPSEILVELVKHCQPPSTAILVLLQRASEYGERILTEQYQRQQQKQQQQLGDAGGGGGDGSNDYETDEREKILSLLSEQQHNQQQKMTNNNSINNQQSSSLQKQVLVELLSQSANSGINNVSSNNNNNNQLSSSSSASLLLQPNLSSPTSTAQYAQTQRSLELMKLWEEVQKFPNYTSDSIILEKFIQSFISTGILITQVSRIMRMLPDEKLDFPVWENLLRACASGRLKDSDVLWKLTQLPPKYLETLLDGSENVVKIKLMAAKKDDLDGINNSNKKGIFGFVESTLTSSGGRANDKNQTIESLLLSSSSSISSKDTKDALVRVNNTEIQTSNSSGSSSSQHQNNASDSFFFPSSWRLSLEVCSHLLSLQNGRSSPILAATHIFLRYLETDGKYVCHPIPVLAFFNVITQQKSNGRHCIHWLVPWRIFQRLNSSNPQWYRTMASADEAKTIVKSLIEILASGAPPVMAFNVARIASGFGIVDGVDIALHLLNRFNVSHTQVSSPSSSGTISVSSNVNKSEVEKIVAKVYSWLTDVVQIHKRQARHNSVVLTARVLIRFGMTNELSDLYTKVLDQASDVDPHTRRRLLSVMEDLVCPHCCSILSQFNIHQDRLCDNCLAVAPAKPLTERSSFELTQGYLKRVREKRKERKDQEAKRAKKMLERLKGTTTTTASASNINNNNGQQIGAGESNKLIMDRSAPLGKPVDAADQLLASIDNDTFVELMPSGGDQQNNNLSNTSGDITWSPSSTTNNTNSMMMNQDLQVPGKFDEASKKRVRQQRKDDSAATSADAILLDISEAAEKQEKVALEKGPSPWVCLWCNELNPAVAMNDDNNNSTSKPIRSCCACGADTGPAAPWRFNFTTEMAQRKKNNQQQQQQNIEDEKDAVEDELFLSSLMKKQNNNLNNNNNDASSRIAAKKEIKSKIRHALSTKELDDMVAAAYYLLLYRKMFLLSADAARGDFVLVQTLIELLIDVQEKTLAACLFMRALPASIRMNLSEDAASFDLTEKLASLFSAQGSAPPHIFNAEENAKKLQNDDKFFFSAVFGAKTCEHCFGVHPSKECAIVTRKFSRFASSSAQQENQQLHQDATRTSTARTTKTLRTSRDEKIHLSISSVSQLVDSLGDPSNPKSTTVTVKENDVLNVYYRFAMSPSRELFATTAHQQANNLALHLCKIGFPKRAVFVACHVPLEYRSNELLTQLAGWFDLSHEDIDSLLKNRVIGDARTKHPNIIQLTRYCCICFNGQHASHNCPRMIEWFEDALNLNNTNNNKTSDEEQKVIKRVSAKKDTSARTMQVNGWTTSGPERLYALYRFLLTRIDDISDLKKEPSEITHALNTAISRLVETNQKSPAWRLFSRTHPSSLKRETIGKVLIMNGVEEMLVEEMMKDVTVGSDWLRLAVPPTACLICFDTGHSFQVCPELSTKSTIEGVLHVLQHVAKHRCAPARGIAAAADYLQHVYVCGALTPDTMLRHQTLSTLMSALAHKCFHHKMTVRGFQILRRLPYTTITPSIVVAFWKSAGIAEDVIFGSLEKKLLQYLQKAVKAIQTKDELIKKAQTTDSSILKGQEFQQAKRALNEITKEYHSFVESPVCRHCHTAGHSILECELILHESEFGRDLLSIFRVLMADSRFSPDEGKRLLIHLVQYLVHYHRHLPYHVIGVSRAMNSLAVLMTMLQMPGLGLRLLLSIPAAYRQRHVYEHLLQAFGVSSAETQRRCQEYLQGCIDASDGFAMTIPDSLLFVCPPIHDVAMSNVFAGLPKVPQALQEANRLLAEDANEIVHKKTGQIVLSSCYDPRRPPQSIEIEELKEAIDPLQRFIEERIDMQIGSRHDLFTKVVELVQDSGNNNNNDDK